MRLALGILWTILALAYPLVVYLGLQYWPPQRLSLALLGLLGTMLLLRWLSSRGTDEPVSLWPLLAAGLLLLGAVLRQGLFVKAVPVVTSAALLTVFALSLRSRESMVERFARRVEPELSPQKIAYCRTVTLVWCWFFVLNITITTGLAIAAPLSWWSLYTGIVAYVLMGGLFTVEYIVRKARFRDYGRGPHDRILAAVFPPRNDAR